MNQSQLVKTTTSRYGTFRHYRLSEPREFVDYVADKLGRKGAGKKSKNLVEWCPKRGVSHAISLGTWGEICSLEKKKLEEVINNPLHKILQKEVR